MQSQIASQIKTLMKFNLAVVAAAAAAAMIAMSAGKASVEPVPAASITPGSAARSADVLTNTTVISKDGDPYFDLHAEPAEHEVGATDLCILSSCIDV